MTDEHSLTETISFELPTLAAAQDLAVQLGPRWRCHAFEEGLMAIVGVLLPPSSDDDLAVVLREVEAWLDQRSLGDIGFWLDGRLYLLRVPSRQLAVRY